MAKRRAESPGTGGRFLVPLVVAAVVGVGVIGYSVSSGVAGRDMVTEPVELTGVESDPQRLVELAQGITLGDPDAPITIMEFADFSCPSCRQFAQSVKPRIELALIQEGRAKLVFHDWPLGSFPHSFLAARAARCVGDQQRYWEYHDALFRDQARWSLAAAPARHLLGYAEALGLDAEAFEACLASDRHAEVVSANQALARMLAQAMNLTGTPSVLIRVEGDPVPRSVDVTFEAISAAIEAIAAGS